MPPSSLICSCSNCRFCGATRARYGMVDSKPPGKRATVDALVSNPTYVRIMLEALSAESVDFYGKRASRKKLKGAGLAAERFEVLHRLALPSATLSQYPKADAVLKVCDRLLDFSERGMCKIVRAPWHCLPHCLPGCSTAGFSLKTSRRDFNYMAREPAGFHGLQESKLMRNSTLPPRRRQLCSLATRPGSRKISSSGHSSSRPLRSAEKIRKLSKFFSGITST